MSDNAQNHEEMAAAAVAADAVLTAAQIGERDAAALAASLESAANGNAATIAANLAALDAASTSQGHSEAMAAATLFPLTWDHVRHWKVRRGNASDDVGAMESAVRNLHNLHRYASSPARREALSAVMQAAVNGTAPGTFKPSETDAKRMPKRSIGENKAHASQEAAYQALIGEIETLGSNPLDVDLAKAWSDGLTALMEGGNAALINAAMTETSRQVDGAMQAARRFRSLLILPLIDPLLQGIVAADPKLTIGKVWDSASQAAYKAVSDKITKAIEDAKGAPVSREFAEQVVTDAVKEKLGLVGDAAEETPEAKRKRIVAAVFAKLDQLRKAEGISPEGLSDVEAALQRHGVERAKAAPKASDPAPANADAQAAIIAATAPVATAPAPTATAEDSEAAANVVAAQDAPTPDAPTPDAPAPTPSIKDKLAGIGKGKSKPAS